jgi:L-fuculose-phosphate aldolase
MANHGVVTYGQDLLTAFFRMDTTEHYARVSLVTELLGKQVLLSGGDVEKLLAARARYGLQTAATYRPDCPVTAEPGQTDQVTISRRELETLVEEAVRRDRAQR